MSSNKSNGKSTAKDENVVNGIKFPPGAKFAFKVSGEYKTKNKEYKKYNTIVFDKEFPGRQQQIAKMRKGILPVMLRESDPSYFAEVSSSIEEVISIEGARDKNSIHQMNYDELVEHVVSNDLKIDHSLYHNANKLLNAIVLYNDSPEAYKTYEESHAHKTKKVIGAMKLNPEGYSKIEVTGTKKAIDNPLNEDI